MSNKSNAELFPWRAGRGAQLRGLSPQRERAGGRRSRAERARPSHQQRPLSRGSAERGEPPEEGRHSPALGSAPLPAEGGKSPSGERAGGRSSSSELPPRTHAHCAGRHPRRADKAAGRGLSPARLRLARAGPPPLSRRSGQGVREGGKEGGVYPAERRLWCGRG